MSSLSVNNSTDYLFNIQTVQSGAFRVLVEALKDILTDCNFIIDETGIKLIATDIDGVWTDSKMYYTDKGEYMKSFSNCSL